MNKWNKFKPHIVLFIGIVGFVADTLTILGAISAELILPKVSSARLVSTALDSLILITGLVGLYSLTMIVWFLFKWKRSDQEHKTFGLDEIYEDTHWYLSYNSLANVIFALIPVLGPFFNMLSLRSVRTIFWFAVFISLFPTTMWVYLVSAQAWIGCSVGFLGSFLLSQYATFFALVLDKFFESNQL